MQYNRSEGELSEAIRSALARVREALADLLPPQEVEGLCDGVLRAPVHRRRALLQRRNRAVRVQVVRCLLERSRGLRRGDLPRALRLARIALELARHLGPDVRYRRLAADLRAEAWAEVADLYSVRGDLAGAESAWRRADRLAAWGSQDPLLLGRLKELDASIRRTRCHLGEALELLQEAVRHYADAEETHLVGRARLQQGLCCASAGEPELALRCVREALEGIEGRRDPQLVLEAAEHLGRALAGLGCTAQALFVIGEGELLDGGQGSGGDVDELLPGEPTPRGGAGVRALRRPAERRRTGDSREHPGSAARISSSRSSWFVTDGG